MSAVVVDTSAAVAVLTGEPASAGIIAILEDADERVMSAATLLELSIVMEARLGPSGGVIVERFIRDGEVTVLSLNHVHVRRALDGWRIYGKGRHSAALDLGDCFTYGLAAELGVPVLCTGSDFAATDLEVLPTR